MVRESKETIQRRKSGNTSNLDIDSARLVTWSPYSLVGMGLSWSNLDRRIPSCKCRNIWKDGRDWRSTRQSADKDSIGTRQLAATGEDKGGKGGVHDEDGGRGKDGLKEL